MSEGNTLFKDKYVDLINSAVKDIEDYYDSSFKIDPERCMPVVRSLIDKLEEISSVLTVNQNRKMEDYLVKTLQAMQSKDYVLLRDYLYYEIRALLLGIRVPKPKQKLYK